MSSDNGNGSSEIKDSLVFAQSSQGIAIRGSLLRLTRFSAVFEVYHPTLVLRTSEVLDDFKIVVRNRAIYAGRAVVQHLVDAGLMAVCEVALNENSWMDVDFTPEAIWNGTIQEGFVGFLQDWQKLYKVRPEFKVVVADMQSFLSDLRLWLNQVELNVRSQPSGSRQEFEHQVLQKLQDAVMPALGPLFERFEQVAGEIETELRPVHAVYAKRLLHPLVLCAPFMYRTFQKPLGYAGDYEMVNMMVRNPFQGGALFAKILNTFFLSTSPVIAHRNRLAYLTQMLGHQAQRVALLGRGLKVLNLGCGPALEVQSFLEQTSLSSTAEFTLLDFNDETVRHTERVLHEAKHRHGRTTSINVVKKSVMQLLKEAPRAASKVGGSGYDIVYCAGLFDYLSDPVCMRLINLFYELVIPEGLVVITNVDPNNLSRGWMEYVVDWYLFYRDAREVAAIVPKRISTDEVRLVTEPTGVNIFVEIRKALHA